LTNKNSRPPGSNGGGGANNNGGSSIPRPQMVPFFASIALPLAREGFRVFPLVPRKKVPAIKGWQDQATTKEATILVWARPYPNANVGIATGHGLVVIDVDLDAGADLAAVEELVLPPTRTCITPHGRHYYYTTEVDVPCSVGRLGPHIDVRGIGGYVVGPGSIVKDDDDA
jgi:putative DNA primase/helicase